MKRAAVACLAALALASCATRSSDGTIAVKLIAFNDFHGSLQPPNVGIAAAGEGGAEVRVPAGGAAYLASAVAALKAANPNHALVSAGDLVGASPLISALFLDEPTILAADAMGLDFAAVGNHEFDRGSAELLRLANGGCEKLTALEPCAVERFPGARFAMLAANVRTARGSTLFPPYGIKTFGTGRARLRIAFIGMTLEGTPGVVAPVGIAGLRFADEADTANALVPRLRARGADAIVVIVHQGATTTGGYNDKSCPGLAGELTGIVDRLDPAIGVVISGHTHRAYVCDYKGRLLTSAGRYGTLLTDIDLGFDARTRRLVTRAASNVIVQGEAFGEGAERVELSDRYPRFARDPAVAALIDRYAAVAAPLAARVIGRMTAPASKDRTPSRESVMGNLIADAQLAATRAPGKGGARIALMSPGGVRSDLTPRADGSVDYGQVFAVQPFGNSLVVKTLTGAQLRAVLEEQFDRTEPMVLSVSKGLSYTYDLARPVGARVGGLMLDGVAVDPAARYRVTMNSFLASGGDRFTLFAQGTEALGGAQDIDALIAYIAAGTPLTPPATGRIADVTSR